MDAANNNPSKEMNMTKSDILNSDAVISSSDWSKGNMDRTYLTLKSSGSYRGDRTLKVYWDNNDDRLVVTRGPGMTSDEMDNSLEAIGAE